jgi:hypothetical protein
MHFAKHRVAGEIGVKVRVEDFSQLAERRRRLACDAGCGIVGWITRSEPKLEASESKAAAHIRQLARIAKVVVCVVKVNRGKSSFF